MAQPAISDFMKVYSGLLGEDISSLLGYSSNIINLFRSRRKSWLEESGFVLNKGIYDRPGIAKDPDGSHYDADNYTHPEAIKANSTSNYGAGSSGGAPYDNENNIDPPTDQLSFVYNERGYGMIQKAFDGPDMSLESLRASAKREQQISAVTTLLTKLAKEYMIRMSRDELARIAEYRFVATGSSNSPTWLENSDVNECYDQVTANRWNTYGFGNGTYDIAGTTDTPDKQNTSILTLGHLEDLYVRLAEEGGGELADDFVDGQPVFWLMTSLQTKRRLITEGSTNGRDVRTDVRESTFADELLKPMGVQTTINGFVMLPEVAPRRFAIEGDSADSSGIAGTGVWAEKHIYATSGSSRVMNSAYRSAGFEESYVIVPRAINCYVPKPYSGSGAAQFEVQNYTGDYKFNVIKDKDDNPDGAHGYFRGKLAQATVAENPYLIYVIRHKRGEGTAA
jgi:hypothetical protein